MADKNGYEKKKNGGEGPPIPSANALNHFEPSVNAIFGDGFERPAFGNGRKQDVRSAGEQMLRNRHRGGETIE